MEELPKSEINGKEKRWNQEKLIVDKITDQLGLNIDEGIKDTVIALRLLGFNTTSSHEGKIDRYPIPYIDISSKETIELINKRNNIISSLQNPEEKFLEEEINTLYKQLSNVDDDSAEALQIQNKIKILKSRYRKIPFPENDEIANLTKKIIDAVFITETKIKEILNEFYKDRNVSEEVKIETRSSVFGYIRLLNHGWQLQEIEKDDKKKEDRLKAFQSEINDFTKFLKDKI